MSIEQHLVRWVMVLPTLVLMLLFLPVRSGGYQFAGLFDKVFLKSGELDFVRLLLQIIILLALGLVLDLAVRPRSSMV